MSERSPPREPPLASRGRLSHAARWGSCERQRLFPGTLLQLPEPGQNLTSPGKLWFSLSAVSLESHVQNTLRRKVQEWTSYPGGSRCFPDCWPRRTEDGTTPGPGARGGHQHFTLNVRSCQLPPHPGQSDGGNAGVNGADGSLFTLGLFQQRKSRAVCPCAKYPRKWPQMVANGHPKSSPALPQPLSPESAPQIHPLPFPEPPSAPGGQCRPPPLGLSAPGIWGAGPGESRQEVGRLQGPPLLPWMGSPLAGCLPSLT